MCFMFVFVLASLEICAEEAHPQPVLHVAQHCKLASTRHELLVIRCEKAALATQLVWCTALKHR